MSEKEENKMKVLFDNMPLFLMDLLPFRFDLFLDNLKFNQKEYYKDIDTTAFKTNYIRILV